jgi:DNA adenine methylase
MAKQQEDNTLTLNFEEAGIENKKSIRLFRDYEERHFLIGYIPPKTKDWIRENKLYNIRAGAENCKGGVDEKDPNSYAVDYIVLYENRYNNRCQIFKADACQYKSREEMAELKYPDPHSDYMVFTLGEEVKFERISLRWLLKQENEHKKGMPLFLTGKELFYHAHKGLKGRYGEQLLLGLDINMSAKPFVKWAGGKGKLLDTIDNKIPREFLDGPVTYIDPFVGGGAVMFHILKNHPNFNRVIINDINPALINCYRIIQQRPNQLIEGLRDLENQYYACQNREERVILYTQMRDAYNSPELNRNSLRAAVLFMFLNKTCFNGLYRENKDGAFNVPLGSYVRPTICNEEIIQSAHQTLQGVTILCGDYRRVIRHINWEENNFFYFDPPYRPLLGATNFNDYSRNDFGDTQQEELAEFCDLIHQHGGRFLLSNSDSEIEPGVNYFERLYHHEGYVFEKIFAPRYINAYVSKRENASEVLIHNYEI